jgi:hypothetical protein
MTDTSDATAAPVVDLRSAQWANLRTDPDRRTKRTAKWAIGGYTRATAAARVLPDFLVIGAQRSGTTSIQKYLGRHPLVSTARFTKGTKFFDRDYDKGPAWYRSHFPTVTEQAFKKMRHGIQPRVGESCSYYGFHPLALERIAATLPRAKLILMLRDPVTRAYSHFNHESARGFEDLGFEEALEHEAERLDGEVERMKADHSYDSLSWRHQSYFTRGLYFDQLQRVYSLFPKEQVLLVESGAFFSDPDKAFSGILDFLGLPGIHLPTYERRYAYQYDRLDPRLAASLAEAYAEPNRRLFEYLNTEFDWTRP